MRNLTILHLQWYVSCCSIKSKNYVKNDNLVYNDWVARDHSWILNNLVLRQVEEDLTTYSTPPSPPPVSSITFQVSEISCKYFFFNQFKVYFDADRKKLSDKDIKKK